MRTRIFAVAMAASTPVLVFARRGGGSAPSAGTSSSVAQLKALGEQIDGLDTLVDAGRP